MLVHAFAGTRRFCRRLCHDCHAGCSANRSSAHRSPLNPFNPLYYLICDNPVQSVSSVGNIVIVIVFVIVFFLSHADCAEITEFPFIWLFVHAGAGIRRFCRRLRRDCHAGCSANRSSANRSPFILSHFFFLLSPFPPRQPS